jgi:hypothetical protein
VNPVRVIFGKPSAKSDQFSSEKLWGWESLESEREMKKKIKKKIKKTIFKENREWTVGVCLEKWIAKVDICIFSVVILTSLIGDVLRRTKNREKKKRKKEKKKKGQKIKSLSYCNKILRYVSRTTIVKHIFIFLKKIRYINIIVQLLCKNCTNNISLRYLGVRVFVFTRSFFCVRIREFFERRIIFFIRSKSEISVLGFAI